MNQINYQRSIVLDEYRNEIEDLSNKYKSKKFGNKVSNVIKIYKRRTVVQVQNSRS